MTKQQDSLLASATSIFPQFWVFATVFLQISFHSSGSIILFSHLQILKIPEFQNWIPQICFRSSGYARFFWQLLITDCENSQIPNLTSTNMFLQLWFRKIFFAISDCRLRKFLNSKIDFCNYATTMVLSTVRLRIVDCGSSFPLFQKWASVIQLPQF